MTGEPRFTFRAYIQGLARLLTSPGDFFAELPPSSIFAQAFGFLLASSIFHTMASLTQVRQGLLQASGILLVNALGMPFVTAAVGRGN